MIDAQTGLFSLLAVLVGLIARRVLAPRPAVPTAPVYGPAYLPPFVRGVLAAYRLGANEDEFLLSLRRDYGTAVYFPWPLCQTVILESNAIKRVYEAPSRILSFFPIRREMQGSAFGAPYWQDKTLLDDQFFPTHSRGMQKGQLTVPLQRFIAVVRDRLDDLAVQVDAAPSGELTIKLAPWIVETYFEASLAGLFGPHVRDAKGISPAELFDAFCKFDRAFPIMASGLVPPFLLEKIPDVKEGRIAQDLIASTFEAWIRDGFDGLEKGVVRDMAEVALNNELGAKEGGKMLVADFWALQANAPYIGVQLLLFLLQAPQDLRDSLLAEIDASLSAATAASDSDSGEPLTFPHLAQTLPLLGSCITETLRLGTSTFSIRVVEQPLVLPTSAGEKHPQIVIPGGNARLICATRVHHLNDEFWNGNAWEWDGRRFLDRAESETEGVDAKQQEQEQGGEGRGWRSRRANQVYGFGGGISRCEGSTFATAELKSFTSLFLSTFDVEVISPVGKAEFYKLYEPIKLAGVQGNGFRPRRIPGRVGMGAYQFITEANEDLEVTIRRRGRRTA